MKKPRQMMVHRFVAACAAAFLASAAPGGEDSPPLRRGADGFGDVRGLTAWVSQDGKDWQEVASDGGSEAGWRIDLGGKSPTAKFVKVGRVGGEKKSLSLAKVFVYGKRLF